MATESVVNDSFTTEFDKPYAVISATFGLKQCIHKAESLEAAQAWLQERKQAYPYGGECGCWIEHEGIDNEGQ